MRTKASKQWTDNQGGSCEDTVEFDLKDNNAPSPLVVRIDLSKMVQTTSANNFAISPSLSVGGRCRYRRVYRYDGKWPSQVGHMAEC